MDRARNKEAAGSDHPWLKKTGCPARFYNPAGHMPDQHWWSGKLQYTIYSKYFSFLIKEPLKHTFVPFPRTLNSPCNRIFVSTDNIFKVQLLQISTTFLYFKQGILQIKNHRIACKLKIGFYKNDELTGQHRDISIFASSNYKYGLCPSFPTATLHGYNKHSTRTNCSIHVDSGYIRDQKQSRRVTSDVGGGTVHHWCLASQTI